MKYLLISANQELDLQEKVNDAIEQGWRPSGGVSACPYNYEKYQNRDGETKIILEDMYFYQAMIKD